MMKKIFVMFFCLIILSGCNVTVTDSTQTILQTNSSSSFIDETDNVSNDNFLAKITDAKKVTKEFSTKDENLSMKVVIEGYSSESMNLDFFIPYNRYSQISISISNNSSQNFYQNLYCGCHGVTPVHNHEILFDIKNDNGDKLQLSSNGYSHTEIMDYWTIDRNEIYKWDIYVAPGSLVEGKDYDLKCDGNGYNCGIKFCDESLFKDNISDFIGTISFPYNTNENYEAKNEYVLICEINIIVGFVTIIDL